MVSEENMLVDITINKKLNANEAFDLLKQFDKSFVPPLNNCIDLVSYSQKLADNAYFIFAIQKGNIIGFVAYYINRENRFLYVPFTAVLPEYRGQGVGYLMFEHLYEIKDNDLDSIQLEVDKNNQSARAFYERSGFQIKEERVNKYLLDKKYKGKLYNP